MSSSARFWDRLAERYAKRPIADETTYQRKLEITQQYFTDESEVLEFGCGTGTTALVHARHVKHILGIDFSPKMIEICERKRVAAKVANVEFRCATIAQIDPAETAYDAILGLNVLHLLPNWHDTIELVARLLKPGGVFVSSTACIADFMAWFRFVAPLGRAVGLLPDLVMLTADELRETLEEHGFEIVEEWLPNKRAALFLVARKRA